MARKKNRGNGNGWDKHSKLVLKELERLDKKYDEMGKQIQNLRIELTMISVRTGIYGALAGAGTAAMTAIGAGILYIIVSR